jgi:thiamine pyrophosphate-dependent acetolactate synthase large subunit-like protein
MAESLGYGEYVERPDEIRPALDRAQREVDRGSVALVNVKTDYRARAARRHSRGARLRLLCLCISPQTASRHPTQ